MAGREVRGLVEAGADMEVVLRESVLIPRGGGAGRDGPAVAFVNRGDAATWVLGCGCRDTGAGVGTDLVMAGLGACPDAETIGRGGVCTGKGLAFMLLKASLASLFALTLSVHLPPFFGTICLTIPDAGTAKLSSISSAIVFILSRTIKKHTGSNNQPSLFSSSNPSLSQAPFH